MECIFCDIVSGKIPADIVYRTDLLTAFRDINPVAPTHVLIIPNQHMLSTQDLSVEDTDVAGHMLLAAKEVARLEGIDDRGYRLIVNTGHDAHQEVQHLHIHVLGGRPMRHKLG